MITRMCCLKQWHMLQIHQEDLLGGLKFGGACVMGGLGAGGGPGAGGPPGTSSFFWCIHCLAKAAQSTVKYNFTLRLIQIYTDD